MYFFELNIRLFTLLKSVFQVDVNTVQNSSLFQNQLPHLLEYLSKLIDALDNIRHFLITVQKLDGILFLVLEKCGFVVLVLHL